VKTSQVTPPNSPKEPLGRCEARRSHNRLRAKPSPTKTNRHHLAMLPTEQGLLPGWVAGLSSVDGCRSGEDRSQACPSRRRRRRLPEDDPPNAPSTRPDVIRLLTGRGFEPFELLQPTGRDGLSAGRRFVLLEL
jgi:hypothetical protein